jgi:hypothetical protein
LPQKKHANGEPKHNTLIWTPADHLDDVITRLQRFTNFLFVSAFDNPVSLSLLSAQLYLFTETRNIKLIGRSQTLKPSILGPTRTMPVSTPRPSKRKHADGERSASKKTKEERRAEKRAKRDAESIALSPQPKPKPTAKYKSEQPVAVPSSSETEFKLVRARTGISLPPRFAGDPKRGVEEILDNLVMR